MVSLMLGIFTEIKIKSKKKWITVVNYSFQITWSLAREEDMLKYVYNEYNTMRVVPWPRGAQEETRSKVQSAKMASMLPWIRWSLSLSFLIHKKGE